MDLKKFLERIKKIRDWAKENGKKPKGHSKDSEENKYVSSLRYINKFIIEPYTDMDDKKKIEYKEKYPEIEEIRKYMDEIKEIERDRRCRTSRKVLNMQKIKTWIEKTDSMRYPLVSSEDEEEKELAVRLSDINHKWLKPLYQLNSTEKKEQYLEKYPELKVVLSIMEEADLIIVRKCLQKLKSIKSEIENKNFEGKLSGTSKDIEINKLIEDFKNVKNIIYNMYGSWNPEKKEKYKEKYPEIEELTNIINLLNNNNKRKNFYKARKIKKWIEEKQKIPYSRSKDEEEKRFGRSLEYIQKQIVESYDQMSEHQKIEYKKKNPDIEDIKEIIGQINELNKDNKRITDMKEIQKWMNENNSIKYPVLSSENNKEKELYKKLYNIDRKLIKPYYNLKTKEQKEEYRKKHPELDEVMSIKNEIDIDIIKRCLQIFNEIKSWIDTNNFTGKLSPVSGNKDVRTLASKFENAKMAFKKIFENWDLEQVEKNRKEYPEIDRSLEIINEIENNKVYRYEENAKKIKMWCEREENNRIPKLTSKDEEERGLAEQLYTIRETVIRPYYRIETKEGREKYRKKRPYFDEVLEIIEGLDEIDIHPYILNARNISKWSNENERMPRRNSSNEEEDKLAIQLKSIRYYVVKPYIELDEQEKEEYRRENDDMCEAIDIITSLDVKYGSKKKKELAALIQKDLEKERILREARILKTKYERELNNKETSQNNSGR